MKLAYFVHDLNDPAVHRRVRMLHAGAAEVALLGFHRGSAPKRVEGVVPVPLGRTEDARLVSRTLSVVRAGASAVLRRKALDGAAVVMARQLETLVLAALARRLHAPQAALVFECLDIHRLMTNRGLAGRLLRLAEGRLLRGCETLVVSSPVFVEEHFARVYETLPRVTLFENKVLTAELPDAAAPVRARLAPPADGPPWCIGWFGMIRCQRSLDLLASLAREAEGRVEVIIRGRVAYNVLPDFDRIVAQTPNLRFEGPYDRQRDLARIYGEVHFLWGVDFYEAGANSAWLLPNRLYEGGLFGAVPVALRNVAVGSWLSRYGAGVLLDDDIAPALHGFFAALTPSAYAALRRTWTGLPVSAFVYDEADCRRLAATLLPQADRLQ